ncbi:protein kinase [Gemmata sp. G18]|uniref:Protein kinase n=1 Tax=Gemmata palustris TaxID=2822762 RepID=A0ABS5BMH2_9BACT|nr:serine/threonine-protein kinase [Gemmata palustris]MBP3954878.1 protein kinase [Gemmata palustris]
MTDDPRTQQLLDELLASDATPEAVCASCPELLPAVRKLWRRIRRLGADLDALFPPPDAGATLLEETELPLIAGYEVEAVLGRGGIGIVFRARHLRLNRIVAMKMLLAGANAAPHERARFQREAEAVAGLRHANIVQIHDVGDVDGRLYFTMEYAEGGSLAHQLAGAPQPPRRAAHLVATLAGAVQAAHERGIVHRDLKPANVLLTVDGTPKVTDFGLARRRDDEAGLTLAGVAVGTPSYMSPEQARGHSDAIGPAVDVYALGAILYELLTGRPPFRAATGAETVQQVISLEPAPPSHLNPTTPRDLETICLKCLHKTPGRRYVTARDLSDDLHRFMDGKPILARPVGAGERAVKWARRRPAAALLIAVSIVMLGLAAGTGLWLRHEEAGRRATKEQRQGQVREVVETALTRAGGLATEERWKEALLVLKDASPQLADADSPLLETRLNEAQSAFQLAAVLERVRQSNSHQPNGTTDREQLNADFVRAFEGTLRMDEEPEQIAVKVRISPIRAQLIAALEDWAVVALSRRDGPLVERLLQIARLADPEPLWRDRFRDPATWKDKTLLKRLAADAFAPSAAPTEHQLALLARLLVGMGAWNQGTELLAEACRRQPRNYWVQREMGSSLTHEGRYMEAAGYYRVAVSLRPDDAASYEGLGLCLTWLGQSAAAIAAYRGAMDVAPDNPRSRARLVGALASAGYWKDAEAECDRALKADPGNFLPLLNLAKDLHRNGRVNEAIVMARRVSAVAPNAVETHITLGHFCAQAGRHEEAMKAFRRGWEMKSRSYPLDQQYARELGTLGRWDEALAVIEAAAARAPQDSAWNLGIGIIYRTQGKPDKAVEVLQKAVAQNPIDPRPLEELARAQLELGRFAEARTAIESRLKLTAGDAERRAQRRQLELCRAMVAVESDLPAVLADKNRPTPLVQRTIAEWCLNYKRRTATSARLFASALSAQPSLADDPEAGTRYQAACAAALAGCGVGGDVTELGDEQRTALRRQALDWLTAEYDACARRHATPADRATAAAGVRSWLRNEDLIGVRDEPALAKLPAVERRNWQEFWQKAGSLGARDPAAKFAEARAYAARAEWKKAATCYAEGMELEPTNDDDLWFEYAAAQLLAKDPSGHRRTCEHMLARCQPAGPMRPYLVARAWTLAPATISDLTQPYRLSKNELDRSARDYWALTEVGALRLRRNDPSGATTFMEKSLVVDGRPGRAVLNWLWLALAYHKSASPNEAQPWLDKATNWLNQQEGLMPTDERVMGSHLHNWLEAHVLRQEVDALLR